ncbi:MAG TPA: POTRA domain-containing protein, partial [Flavobacteriales bacterium]|nr:POTRA domain-containing protein [Flavobacteriales bacterium]
MCCRKPCPAWAPLLVLLCSLAMVLPARAQKLDVSAVDYGYPREFTIGGITVSGCVTRDPNAVKLFSGLKVGDKITVPGERIGQAIRAIWDQKLFTDVRIEEAELRGNTIFLHIIVQENPQLASYGFAGTVSRSEGDKLREKIGLQRGQQVNEAVKANAVRTVSRYFVEKGFLRATARTVENRDTSLENSVRLQILADKGPRVKIKDVRFHGNENLSDTRLRRTLKKTKRKRWYNIFGSSKFQRSEYTADKNRLIDLYNEKGYRNAVITKDTLYFASPRRIALDITVDEGNRFYFRDISFTGNTKYSNDTLVGLLGIRRGDVYNKKKLDSRLYMNPSGVDISSLYMDQGYLSFNPEPIERVEGDSIDLEIRIREGKQYRVRDVTVVGNTKTFDHVIRRELRTRPGDLFDRSEVIRSQQQLISLGF